MKVRFLSAGDRALVVEFGDRVDRRLSERVLRLDAIIRSNPPPGIVETVPTFRSLAVYYDPLLTSRGELQRAITPLLDLRDNPRTGAKLWQVPVCYEGEFAPDLAEVARLTGLTPNDVVALHSGTRFHVYMLGFLPGQAYMGEVAAELALDRLETPRTKIPAGSLAIASRMSCVFPLETPCGWHVIGRCPVPLWDPVHGTSLLAPADQVKFVPVPMREYETLATRASQGVLRIEPVSEFVGAVA